MLHVMLQTTCLVLYMKGTIFFTFTMQIIGGSSALFIDSCSVVYIATGDFLKKSVFFRNYQLW